jgi:hypothetical protein
MKTELIKISEFQRRVWGEGGTPLTPQAIRDQLRNDILPGKQIGKLWFVDWAAYSRMTGFHLVDAVLKRAS